MAKILKNEPARTVARLGVARLGATRMGYVPPAPLVDDDSPADARTGNVGWREPVAGELPTTDDWED